MHKGITNFQSGGRKVCKYESSIIMKERGDILTVAHNPVRDTLFAECPELYYLIGEGSVAISNIGTDVMGLGAAAKLGGTQEFLKQCGILAGTEFVEDTGATFLVETLGMSEYEAAIAMMVLGTVTYEGVNVATGNWRRKRSVLDTDSNTYGDGIFNSFADMMSTEDAVKYNKWVELREAGPPDGTFVMPKSVADEIIQEPNGLRMPSGNELGANEQWIPVGGIPESTIDSPLQGEFISMPIFE